MLSEEIGNLVIMFPQVAQMLFLEKAKEQRMLKIFVYPDAENGPARNKWCIFGLISTSSSQMISAIFNTIKQHLDGDAMLRGEFDYFSTEIILEKILQRINEKIFKMFINSRDANVKIADILLVAVKESQISVAGCGGIFPIFIRKNERGRSPFEGSDPQKYDFNIINLFEGLEDNVFDSARGFQNIVTGEIQPGDILIINTKQLWDFISNENILDYFLRLPPRSAVEFVRNRIDNLDDFPPKTDSDLSWGKYKNNLWGAILVLSWRTREMYLKNAKTVGKFNASFAHLVSLTERTEKILTSSFNNILVKNTLKSILNGRRNLKKSKNENDEYERPPRRWQNKYRFFFRTIARLILAVFIVFFRIFKDLYLFISNRSKIKFVNFNLGLEDMLKNIISKFNLFPIKAKSFLVITIALSVMLSQSVFVVNSRLNQKKAEQEINQTVQKIRENLTAAEASMIYKDNATAYNSIMDSINLLETLPQKTKMDKLRRMDLAEEIDKIRFSYQRIAIIQDPVVVANLNEEIGKQMFIANGKLIILTDENNFYVLNPRDGKALLSNTDETKKLSSNYRNQTAFFRNNEMLNSGLPIYAKSGKSDVKWDPLDPPITETASGNKVWTSKDSLFLYVLDPAGKRLIIYNKNGNLKKQYSSPQFSDLKDFAVDEKNKQLFLLSGNKILGLVTEHLSN